MTMITPSSGWHDLDRLDAKHLLPNIRLNTPMAGQAFDSEARVTSSIKASGSKVGDRRTVPDREFLLRI